jgi:hypothetical protein
MEYFDLQVNGYGGVDFNTDGLSPDDLHRACVNLVLEGGGLRMATTALRHPPSSILHPRFPSRIQPD